MSKLTILLYTIYILFGVGVAYMQVVSWVAMWGWASFIYLTIAGIIIGGASAYSNYTDWKDDFEPLRKSKPTC